MNKAVSYSRTRGRADSLEDADEEVNDGDNESQTNEAENAELEALISEIMSSSDSVQELSDCILELDISSSEEVDETVSENSSSTRVVSTKFSKGQLKEQKWWSVLKNVPVVGTVYGALRAPIYGLQGHKDEAYRSVAGSLGNLAGTGAAVVGAFASGPLIVPVLASIVGGGAVQQIVGGGGEAIVDGRGGNYQAKTDDEKETFLYEKIFRDTPVVGGVYSVIRARVYKRRNPEEASKSYSDAAVNVLSSGVAVGIGYGAAKWANGVTSASRYAKHAKKIKIAVKDTVKTAPSIAAVGHHEFEESCTDIIPKASERIMQVFMILENTLLCEGNCKIAKRLSFLVLNCLDETFRLQFSSSAILTLAVLRAGIPFLQTILCFKPSLLEQLEVAREFIEIGEEELRSNYLSAPRRLSLEVRLELVRYFLEVIDPNFNGNRRSNPNLPSSSCSTISLRDIWSRPQFRKYRVSPEKAICLKPILKSNLDPLGPRVLNLDGGGTRGLLLLELLEEFEKRTNKRISDCFEYITGTSTGGIIALCLALGHNVAYIRKLYFHMKDKIFEGWRPYKHEVLENELKKAFGETTTMRDIKGVRVIITASVLTGRTFDTKLLTNFEPEFLDIPLWEVARSTTAAPTYFEPHKIRSLGETFYDGGLGANNPTMTCIYKISDHQEMKHAVIVSLGTGKCDTPTSHEPIKMESSIKMVFNGELKRLVEVLVEQVAKSDGEPVTQAKKTCEWMKAYYFRLTPNLPENIGLDETDDQILINLIFHTKAYIAANSRMVDEICELLLSKCNEVNSGTRQ